MNEKNEPKANNPKEPRISLTTAQQQAFHNSIKNGLYKELHRKGLLTDMQLNSILNMQK